MSIPHDAKHSERQCPSVQRGAMKRHRGSWFYGLNTSKLSIQSPPSRSYRRGVWRHKVVQQYWLMLIAKQSVGHLLQLFFIELPSSPWNTRSSRVPQNYVQKQKKQLLSNVWQFIVNHVIWQACNKTIKHTPKVPHLLLGTPLLDVSSRLCLALRRWHRTAVRPWRLSQSLVRRLSSGWMKLTDFFLVQLVFCRSVFCKYTVFDWIVQIIWLDIPAITDFDIDVH